MELDSNLAWKQASEAVTANREVLIAIAGVFILLPNLAFALLYPQPELAPGLQGKEAMEALSAYYTPAMPWLLLVSVFQAVGTLSLLTLFTDRSRPTVGEAIRQGAICLIPYILAHLLLGMGIGLIGAVLIGMAAATGLPVVAALVVVAMLVGLIYVLIKTSLTSPAIAVEGVRNPVQALKRSWQLTKGNSLRIFAFYLLIGIIAGVVLIVTMLVIGALLAVLLGVGDTAKSIATVISSVLSTGMTIYFVSIVAAVHRQLAGPSAEAVNATFE